MRRWACRFGDGDTEALGDKVRDSSGQAVVRVCEAGGKLKVVV